MPGKSAAAPARRPFLKAPSKRTVLTIIIPGAAALIGLGIYLSGGRYVSTDNAYVGSDKVAIAPEVSGKITETSVSEGDHVEAGDLLFRIDDAPYALAVRQAEAKRAQAASDYATTRSDLQSIAAQIDLARDDVATAHADVVRKSKLTKNQYFSPADLDKVKTTLTNAQARLEQLQQHQAQLLNALAGDPDLPLAKFPPYAAAEAALGNARRDLSNTVLRAPVDGVATHLVSVQRGQLVGVGEPVMTIVETDTPWVDANLKETQLTHIHPGEQVRVKIDAYPGKTWPGRVTSISPGTGAAFSLLPAQNASGNWVKVVQRIPVRIHFAPGVETHLLRTGMSAHVRIDTDRPTRLAGMFGAQAAEPEDTP